MRKHLRCVVGFMVCIFSCVGVALADATTSLNAAALQTVLTQSQNGFAGLSFAKNNSCSDDSSDCYDVSNDPSGFDSCTITVQRSDADQATWFCTIFEGQASDMDQAWAQASAVLHAGLAGWTFVAPSSALKRLVAIEPGAPGRKIYIDALARTILIGCIVTNANVH